MSSYKICVLQHAQCDPPAMIVSWAASQDSQKDRVVALERFMVPEIGNFPSIDNYDGFLVLGGPMGAYEEESYPWLAAEKRYIESIIRSGKKLLGICLGCQLIADVLGARVYQGPGPEIGWHEVSVADRADSYLRGFPQNFLGLHWHGDTFDLPAGATRLASSQLYENQAFSVGEQILALQFHLEFGQEDVRRIASYCSKFSQCSTRQSLEFILESQQRFSDIHRLLYVVLDGFFGV